MIAGIHSVQRRELIRDRDGTASAGGARSEAKPSEAAVDPGCARIRTRKC